MKTGGDFCKVAMLSGLIGVAAIVVGDTPMARCTADERPSQGDKASDRKAADVASAQTQNKPTLVAQLVDGGQLSMTLVDERIEYVTPYGKLSIPAVDIERIEFGVREAANGDEQVQKAIANLGSDDFKVREAASIEPSAMGTRAMGALSQAIKHADVEVAHRAAELLTRLQRETSTEPAAPSADDVIHTKESKFTGRLAGESLRVKTLVFGEQQVRFAHLRSLRSSSLKPAEPLANIANDPGTMTNYQQMVGQSMIIRVTGHRNGAVWGTDTYTLDSTLATAAVHAGVVRVGQTATVRVTILGPQFNYTGTIRNGVSSASFGQYPGSYTIKPAGR